MTSGFSLFPLFEWNYHNSAEAGFIVLAIVAVTGLLRRRIPIKWQYALWFILLFKLILPWTPESPVSLFQYVPDGYSDPHVVADQIRSLPASGVTYAGEQMIITSTVPSGVGDYVSIVAQSLFWIWAVGVALVGGILLKRNVKFALLVRKSLPVEDAGMTTVLERCKQRMGVRGSIPLLQTDIVATPALYGVWRPVILMPQNASSSYGLQECEHIFTHELVHYKRRDITVNWLMSILLALHWFNPLLWYAAYRMRADQEFACDAAALSILGAGEAGPYAHTLIKLLETRGQSHSGPRTAYFSGASTYFRKRISMIVSFRASTLKSSFIGMLCLLLIGCATLTGGSEDNTDVVAEFRDYKVTKQMVKEDMAPGSDAEKIKRNLIFHMIYREAVEQGIEADLASVDKEIEEAKQSTDTETVKAHEYWMNVYGLQVDAYWNKMQEDLLRNSVLNQYTSRILPDPKELGGHEYKRRYIIFMNDIYEKYKSEVKVYYDRLDNKQET